MSDDVISIEVGGTRYDIDPLDFTANDAGDFRRAVGVSLAEAVRSGAGDLDVIAGLVWLVRRKTNKGLAYSAVADTVTYGNVSIPDDDAPVPLTEVLGNPE